MATGSDLHNLEANENIKDSPLLSNGVAGGCLQTKTTEDIRQEINGEQRTEESSSVNSDSVKTDENLIDLDTPVADNFNAFLRCRLIERASALRKADTDSVMNKDASSNFLPVGKDSRVGDQSMNLSHTESGYLTDSVTSSSTVGNERHESLSSESDRTPCGERASLQMDNSTHSNITDGVFACNSCIGASAADDCDKPRTNSTGSTKALDLINALDNLKELELGDDVRLKTGPRKLIDLDEIFVKCDASDIQTRPESLSLSKQMQYYERPHSKSDAGSAIPAHVCEEDRVERKRSKSSGFPIPRVKEGVDISDEGLSKSLPHGMIMRKGDMIEFVADDLQEKIRRSSPMSKTASSVSSRRSSLISISSNGSSTMATSVTSGMSRSPSSAYPQSPDLIPPIDPIAIVEIENQARLVADSLDLMMGNLRNNLHKMSAISVGCEEAYKTSVDVTCETVDSSIKAMYALMAKCEELSTTMQPVYKLADQIKEIKRLLDRFESQLTE